MSVRRVRGESWARLSEWQKHEVAIRLVSHLLYAPSSDDEPSPGNDTNLKRELAVQAMLARAAARDIDRLMDAIVAAGDPSKVPSFKTLAKPVIEKWQPNWVHSLYHSDSSASYNKQQFRKSWPKLVNLYLIAVALVRQRRQIANPAAKRIDPQLQQPGLRRAIWLVVKSYPSNCEYRKDPKGLERLVEKWQVAWPLICGLLHGLVRPLESAECVGPIHQLLPAEIPREPKARDLVRLFTSSPNEVLSAAEFFKQELSAKGKVLRQMKPPLDASMCISLPDYTDLHSPFVVPQYLTGLTAQEIVVAQGYGFDAYNKLRLSRLV